MHVYDIIRPVLSAIDLSSYGTSAVYDGIVPQGQEKDTYIIMRHVSGTPYPIKDGYAALDKIILQVDVYRSNTSSYKNQAVCRTIAGLVRNTLDSYSDGEISIYYNNESGPTYEHDSEKWRHIQEYKILQHR